MRIFRYIVLTLSVLGMADIAWFSIEYDSWDVLLPFIPVFFAPRHLVAQHR